MKAAEFTHTYGWKNNERRAAMFGRPCRVVVRGAMGSVMVEFEDGQREIISRRALRRLGS